MSTATHWPGGPPPGYPGYHPPPERKGLGIAAMVLGIVALVLAFVPFVAIISFLLGPLAVILGVVGLVKRRGRGQAITGIVTGAIGLLIAIIGFLIFGALLSSIDEDAQQTQGNLETETDGPAAGSDEEEVSGDSLEEQEGDQETEEGGAASDEDAPAENDEGELVAEEQADGGETFTIGDEFEVNDWIVKVTGVGDRTPTIGDEYFNTEAQGEYLPIDLIVTNNGNSASYFFARDFVAVDRQDREFSYSSDAIFYGASEGAVSILDEINPGNSIEGRLYFDVPTDAEITGLDINAGFLSDTVRVSLD